MKKVILSFAMLIGINAFSQSESKLICKTVDEFTDETSVSSSDMFLVYEDGGDMKTEGIVGTLFVQEKKGFILNHSKGIIILWILK